MRFAAMAEKAACYLAIAGFCTAVDDRNLALPSGGLRNKKSINLVYVRPGVKGQTA